MTEIPRFIKNKYPKSKLIYRQNLIRVLQEFIASNLADNNFETDLTSGVESKFWARLSEALIYNRLQDKHFLDRANSGGPDFLLDCNGQKLWIEVICPEPTGVPREWLEPELNQAFSFPANEVLLRWTSAFKEKAEKLLDNSTGYLSKKLVVNNDIYVIVINGCQLRSDPFPAFHGISQFPNAAEAVFPIGPQQIHINRMTSEIVGRGYQERFSIPKPNGSKVTTHAFIDPKYQMISAIWAVDFIGSSLVGKVEHSAVIHNPLAINPLAYNFLPSEGELCATPCGENEYSFGAI